MTAAWIDWKKRDSFFERPRLSIGEPSSWKLSREGKGVVEAAFSCHAAELDSAMAVLTQREKRQLHALLRKLGLFAAEAVAKAPRAARGSE